jgi:hypothetical protein
MAKTKGLTVGKQSFGKRKNGSYAKSSGPKVKSTKQYRGQGR